LAVREGVVFDPYPAKLLLTTAEVQRMLGMTRSTFRRLRADDPRFPRPRMAGRSVRYLKEDVMAWSRSLPPAPDGVT
jgi:excisionase family DNA binding protein